MIKEMSRERKILLTTLVAAAILFLIGLVSGDVGVLGNTIIFATFTVATPQLFFAYEKYRALKDMESKFPLFLRDMIDSIRSGMPFHKAIMAVGGISYGPLSKEIKTLSNQISWGMTLDKALKKFGERLKGSRRLFSAVQIIRESHRSGGDVVNILESVAESTTVLDDAEKERKSLLNQYVVLMYAVALIFIGIVVSINKLLIPIFSTAETATIGAQIGLVNPCADAIGFNANVCGVYNAVAQYIFFIEPTTLAAYYISLFFVMAMIQSLFSGLVAGELSENSLKAGIKHSLILLGITFGAFSILLRLGLLV